jgi:hypothetical protein
LDFSIEFFAFSKNGKQVIAVQQDRSGSGDTTWSYVRVSNVSDGSIVYESRIPRTKSICYLTEYDALWSVNYSNFKVQIHKLQPAPSTFSTFNVGTNRARFKTDTVTAVLKGEYGEPVPNWPLNWYLSGGSQGRYRTDYTETDSTGTSTNTYYGPGFSDFTGANQTLNVSTGY